MMRSRKTFARSASISLKPWLAGIGFLTLMALAMLLLSFSRNESAVTSAIRTGIHDGLVPVVSFLSAPVTYIERFNVWLDNTMFVYAQNERLRQENMQLMQWQNAAQQLSQENTELRNILTLPAPPKISFVTSRVVGGIDHMYSQSALLNSGRYDGVQRHRAVLTHEGLVGRVAEVGNRSGQVLLITDINSRIPVMTQNSRAKAILSGNNSGTPSLRYLPEHASISVGERIVTANDGGILPAGLPVGEVTAIKGSHVVVTPYADFNKMEYVRIANPQIHSE